MRKAIVSSKKIESQNNSKINKALTKDAPDLYLDIKREIFNNNYGPKGYVIKKYKENDELPEIIRKIIERVSMDIKAPKKIQPQVIVGIFSRKSRTIIEAPPDSTVLRILFNYGFDDTYILSSEYYETRDNKKIVLNSGLDDRRLFIEKNKYVILGPAKTSKYTLRLEADPKILIPADNGIGAPKSSLRPRDYERITLVLDYLGPDGMIDKIADVATSELNKIKVNQNASSSEINAQINRVKNNVINNNKIQEILYPQETVDLQEQVNQLVGQNNDILQIDEDILKDMELINNQK